MAGLEVKGFKVSGLGLKACKLRHFGLRVAAWCRTSWLVLQRARLGNIIANPLTSKSRARHKGFI